MVEPARAVARSLARRAPVWLYRFDYVATSLRAEAKAAPHASEIPYVMDTVATKYGVQTSADDQRVAALMHAYWVAFAKSGQPKANSLPPWPRAGVATDDVQWIDAAGAQQRDDPLTNRLNFMERFSTGAP
jgi:para-nitrobenzyl esterase